MEIAIAGEGEVLIRYIDSRGETLLQEKLVVSGSPTVEGRRAIDLSIRTTSGPVPIAPVLIRQSSPMQRVTFDGEPPPASRSNAAGRSAARPRSSRPRSAGASRRQRRPTEQCGCTTTRRLRNISERSPAARPRGHNQNRRSTVRSPCLPPSPVSVPIP